MTITKQRLAAYLFLAALAGWYVAGIADTRPDNPRPGVRFIQRVLRWAPLLLFFTEPPAPAGGAAIHAHPHDAADEHVRPIGVDGWPLVDHRGAL